MNESQVLLEIAALAAGALGRHVAPAAVKRGRQAVHRPVHAPEPVKLPAFGIDYAYGRPSPRRLRSAGVKFVVRYLSPDPAKNLTRRESLALERAGIKRILVWESTANRALDGAQAGAADAREALRQANASRMPVDRPVYFAVDFDATGPDIEPYFQGIRSVLAAERVGVYGGYAALDYLRSRGLVKRTYQTYAWSGGRWLADPAPDLIQYDNGRELFGVNVDFDHAMNAECGWW